MVYELKHNNDVVLLADVDDKFRVNKIIEIYNKEKIPTGLIKNNNIDTYELNQWIASRGIPAKREGIEYILEKENVDSVRELLFKNNALGLTDHYWIAEKKSDLSWEDVNYFDNDDRFDKLGDDVYLGVKVDNFDHGRTPSSSASGMQPKRWVIHQGERWLLKSSEELSKQEPYSEIAASIILDKMNINHVKYSLLNKNDEIVSGCPSMLDKNSELIPAFYICIDKKGNNESNLDHFIRNCNSLGVNDNIRTLLEQMIVVDYLIANTDRHWNNFALIRNAGSLKFERFAPLYDHGDAFYTKIHHLDIPKKNVNLECKSFRKTQEENLKLVKNIDWLKTDVLNDIPDIINDIFKSNKYGSSERTNTIVSCINDRISSLKRKLGIQAEKK